ncbi:Uncharacterised protein [Enterobacter hormaechei]|nr:hypothetical protein L422_03960 [Enterobacter hormaechei]VAE12587.1 Uncharacterised protein [Enterobacter hormaechei]VAF53589.1 Uncharacterised protein [Enterobacter hormaechei]
MDKCPDCQSPVVLSGKVSCWCDRDNCFGQRCGADSLYDDYTCTNQECGKTGTPDKTKAYYERHSR